MTSATIIDTERPPGLLAGIQDAPPTASGIRRRVIVFGIGLSLLAFWLVIRMEHTDQTGLPTGLGIYFHVVVLLMALVLGNAALGRIASAARLSRAELLCLYSMMSVSSAYACFEFLGTQLDLISVPGRWLASDASHKTIAAKVFRLLPDWAVLHDPAAAVQLYAGRGTAPLLWKSWLLPAVGWGLILTMTQVMAAAACRLLYDRWAHQEKLSFPLTALPLDLSDPKSEVWKTPAFRIGFMIAALLDLMNGLHTLFPALPFVNVKMIVLSPFGTSTAWQAVGSWVLTFHPLMIGLAFLMPMDILFSCWLFFLVGKAQLYAAGALNMASGSSFQFGHNVPGLLEQNSGAMLIFGMATLRSAKGYLLAIWREALSGDQAIRRDIVILIAGTVIWAVILHELGLAAPLIPLFLVIAGLISLVVTRLRCEMGLPAHNFHGQGPEMLIGGGLEHDPGALPTLTALMSLHGLLRSEQGNVMPHLMEGRFMAERAGGQATRYWSAVLLAGLAATLIGPWIYLNAVSAHGLALNGYNPFPEEGWAQLAHWAQSPSPPDYRALSEVGIGAAVMLGLIALRGVWPDSPFHPIGYAICGGWGLSMIVTPIFIAWLVKSLVMRYGGLRLYRSAVPFAYGLILGEFVLAVFWAIMSIVLHCPTYRVWLF